MRRHPRAGSRNNSPPRPRHPSPAASTVHNHAGGPVDASVPELDAAVGADALDALDPLDPDAELPDPPLLAPPLPDEPDDVAGAALVPVVPLVALVEPGVEPDVDGVVDGGADCANPMFPVPLSLAASP